MSQMSVVEIKETEVILAPEPEPVPEIKIEETEVILASEIVKQDGEEKKSPGHWWLFFLIIMAIILITVVVCLVRLGCCTR